MSEKESTHHHDNDHDDHSNDQDHAKVEKVEIHQDEVLANPELMNDAFEGENLEHQMGSWEAAKKHPWACFWAFMMCFTIVSFPFPFSPAYSKTSCTFYFRPNATSQLIFADLC